MQYKDMKEMTIKEWDGKPFQAYFTDNEYKEPVRQSTTEITGWDEGRWLSRLGFRWLHVYPVEWNKPTPKRMTNRQLAEWLAQGNGEYIVLYGYSTHNCFSYPKNEDNKEVDKDLRVRTWDSEEWIEPTTDLLKGDN